MKATGHKVLITGATSGIGLALAEKFTALGNTVIATGRSKEKLALLAQKIPQLITFCCDLASREGIDELIIFIEREHQDLNILVNNAGIQYNYDFLSSSQITYKIDHEIKTNLIAPLQLCALLIPLLQLKPEAAIINISSGLAIAPKKTAPVYCGTKAGIHIFSQALRFQLENSAIKVFEIIPPLVDTPMTAGRGKNKISPQALVEEFWPYFLNNTYEIYIGKARLLNLIYRLSPALALKIMKNG
jgi:short-subunit dehydrogenase involved in D-alanine esterification of teichoic acids